MRRKLCAPALLAIMFFVFNAGPAAAQYFGQNKVVYKNFDFSILKTAHFQIYHYPRGSAAVEEASRTLETWYAKHQDVFGFGISGPQKVILYDSFIDFEQTNAVPGLIPQGEGGVTEGLEDRIIIPLTGVGADDYHVLGHELVHAFQFQRDKGVANGFASPQQLPLWFVEGQAEYLSLGQNDPLTSMWMRDAVLHDDVPSVADMSAHPEKYFPYRFGEALWAYIDREWGTAALRAFFNQATMIGISAAAGAALGTPQLKDLSDKWKDYLRFVSSPVIQGRTQPKDVGTLLKGLSSPTNLSPEVSPDGKYVAVFSQRDLFSFNLFLADAATGRVLKTLGSSATDAHYDALHFIDSAGGWSPDSRSFAFPVEKGGHDGIAIVSVPDGRLQKVTPLKDVVDVTGIAWSPDGRELALSGTVDAQSDLWLLDVASGALHRLTNDRYAELQPAWSPDGTTLAFATDRGARTDAARLVFGSMNIGLLDVKSGQLSIVSLKDGAKHINPLFSADGKSLYFVSDPDGVSDIYRYSLDTAQFFRVTKVATGVSGLTALSPCLSLAQGTGSLVFTVFDHRGYPVHALSSSDATGVAVSYDGAVAPPQPFTAGAPAAPGVPQADITPYRTTFNLLSVSGLGIGLSLDQFGPAVGGSAELLFQDILGNHLIDVAAQASGSLDTLAGQLLYSNTANRIAWGIGVAHVPQANYVFLAPPFSVAGADTAIVQQQIFYEEADVQAMYPLSVNRRLEGDIGYTGIWYEQMAPVFYYQGGVQVAEDQVSLATPPPLNLAHAGLAWVGDYSFQGFTDPVRGSRYRFELDGYTGSVSFLSAIADARAYLFLNPFTVAFRALSTGRYLGGADNPTLGSYYLGDPSLVRGYEYYSIISNEGASAAGGDVPQIDRLFGSKVAVVNAELRLPVLGNGELGLFNFSALPVSLVGFFDGGVAWTESSFPVFQPTSNPSARIPVFSAGAAVRVNLLGAAILQIYWAWPFQRPDIGGSWGFLIEAGW